MILSLLLVACAELPQNQVWFYDYSVSYQETGDWEEVEAVLTEPEWLSTFELTFTSRRSFEVAFEESDLFCDMSGHSFDCWGDMYTVWSDEYNYSGYFYVWGDFESRERMSLQTDLGLNSNQPDENGNYRYAYMTYTGYATAE